MDKNHQYIAGTESYSVATELTYVPTWISGIQSNEMHNLISVVRCGSFGSISGFLVVNPNVIPIGTVLTTLPVEFRPNGVVIIDGFTIVNAKRTGIVFNLQPDGSLINDDTPLTNYFYFNTVYNII